MSQELYSSASSDDQSSINSVVHVPPRSSVEIDEDGAMEEDVDSDLSEGRLAQVCSDAEYSENERMTPCSGSGGLVSDELDNENLEHGDTTTDSEQDSLLSGDRRARNDSVSSSSSEETQVWVPLRASPKVSGLRHGSGQMAPHMGPGHMRQSIVSQNSATGRIETALTMEEITGFNADSGISNESPETQSSGEMTHLHLGGSHSGGGGHYGGGHYGGTHYVSPHHLHHLPHPHSRPPSHMMQHHHSPLTTIPSPPHSHAPSISGGAPGSGVGGAGGGGVGGSVDALRDGPDPLFVSQSQMDAHFRHSLFNTLSCLYALLLVVIGTVLPLAETIAQPIHTGTFESFYIYLYVVSMVFLLYVYVFMLRTPSCSSWGGGGVTHNCLGRSVASSLHTAAEDSLLRGNNSTTGAGGRRHKHAGAHGGATKHRGSGSFYLRIGAVGFGIGAMIHEGLMFGELFEYEPVFSCLPLVVIIKPIFHLIFIFIQLYFIFLNSKMYVSRYKVLARFGLMHMIATNLCVWIRTVVMETVRDVRPVREFLNITQQASEVITTMVENPEAAVQNNQILQIYNTTGNFSSLLVTDTPTFVEQPISCQRQDIMRHVVDRASPYLYPCTIQYSLIAAGILYVMWCSSDSRDSGASSCTHGAGADGGGVSSHHDYPSQLTGGGHGTVDSRVTTTSKKSMVAMNVTVDCSGATRGLFLGIFTLVATIISMIVFFVLVERPRYVQVAVAVVHASDLTLQCLAAVAVMIAAYKMRDMKFDHRRRSRANLDEVMLGVSLAGLFFYHTFCAVAGHYYTDSTDVVTNNGYYSNQMQDDMLSSPSSSPSSSSATSHGATGGELLVASSALVVAQAGAQAVFVAHALRRSAQKPYHSRVKPGREYVTFLLMCNVAAWGVGAVESPRTQANPLAAQFYGVLPWAVVMHVSAPLAMFYRFHSTVCLANIWKNAYKQKLH